jgi:chemotaxis protein CheX
MAELFNVGDEIIAGIRDVFSTMLMVDLASDAVVEDHKCDIQSNLTSMIGLGGGLRGLLALHCPASVAKSITGAFLGMDIDDINEDVKDAIGEIVNMVAGNLKTAFAKIDVKVELAIPTSVVGESFNLSGISNAKRIVVPLKMAGDTFWVELMYVLAA